MLVRGLVALAVWTFACLGAHAEPQKCRGTAIGEDFVEWLDGATPRGVKFAKSPGWEQLLTQDAVYLASCKTCRGGQGIDAVFWADVEDRSQQNLAALLQPARIVAFWSNLPGFAPLEVQSSGSVELFSVFGMDGLARRVSARTGPNPVELMVTASASGCLVVMGLVILPGVPNLTAEDFRPFATSMTLQAYEPIPLTRLAPLGQDCFLPLGINRRRCDSVWPR